MWFKKLAESSGDKQGSEEKNRDPAVEEENQNVTEAESHRAVASTSGAGQKRKKDDIEQLLLQMSKKEKTGNEDKSRGSSKKLTGFEMGWTVEAIVGVTRGNGKMQFRVKWKETQSVEAVNAEEMKLKSPQHVIQFYEDLLLYRSDDSDSD